MKRLRTTLFVWVGILLLIACSPAQSDNSPTFVPIQPPLFPEGLGAGFPVVQMSDGSASDVGVGQAAPNFAFVWDDGRGADLTSLRGKPVILNFWATWCGPCRAEMPEFVKLHDAGSDVVILEVNAQEVLEVIRPFAEEFGMRMPVLVDEVGAVRQLYGVRAMPTTLFIDAKGIIQARWAGLLTGDQLDQFAALIQAK